jgi:hypothetical protein
MAAQDHRRNRRPPRADLRKRKPQSRRDPVVCDGAGCSRSDDGNKTPPRSLLGSDSSVNYQIEEAAKDSYKFTRLNSKTHSTQMALQNFGFYSRQAQRGGRPDLFPAMSPCTLRERLENSPIAGPFSRLCRSQTPSPRQAYSLAFHFRVHVPRNVGGDGPLRKLKTMVKN